MGNCRGCAHVKGDKKVFNRGEDIQMFRCGYAEEEFGGERWVADLEGCSEFKSVIPDEGTIEFLRQCNACGGSGKSSIKIFGSIAECYGCSGTGQVEMFPKENEN
ncbi:hypothetical protein [Bacillus toyonensis]|uniref:hypothetical protein n=1 Tax=Bacillus toyonensis TaxID=155322 RepID=UPI00124F26FB|nr:hypothetical protein [Bacillus toyonensis]KAB2380220.1 hypothetical protein F8507_27445 [Bacillus toyonensis]